LLGRIFACFLLLLLSACSHNKNFYLNKKTYDPFTIYRYPSLSLPPIYYLSSQEIIDERRYIKDNQNVVQDSLFNLNVSIANSMKYSSDMTAGDKQLLVLARANRDFSGVRAKIDEETQGKVIKDKSLVKRIYYDNQGEGLDDKLSEYFKYNHK